GWVGTQRYPGTWAGDTQTTWEAFRCCLRGGLSVGFTGECFWSHDIGGFVGDMPSPELYIRWLQLGMLSPFTRFHGNGVREPWHYGDTAVAVARYYGRLRYRLIPYLLALAEEAVAEGIPLQRHCALACPDEPGMAHLDDQFLLGSDLLVAPVQEAGARQRLVCLPRGTWYVFEDDQRLAGGSWHEIAAPLERMPVLVRGGALLPSYEEAQQHLKEAVPDLLQWDCWPASAPRRVARHFDDGGGMVRASHDSGPAGGRITIHAGDRPQLVHLHGIPVRAIQAPAEARIREADGITTVDCPAIAELTIDYTSPG
ncbi:MAG: glycoside hydrolase family 31 protein, partial [Planctomycetota bacterium]